MEYTEVEFSIAITELGTLYVLTAGILLARRQSLSVKHYPMTTLVIVRLLCTFKLFVIHFFL